MRLNTVYVTVGTTKFDSLINKVTSDEVLQILKSKGCKNLILQLGNGSPVDVKDINDKFGIAVDQYEFKYESVRSDIINSDLIIGHAGAGTCMDILNNGKPGLVVVNEELMNNHQIELAEQLGQEKYLYFCSIENIASCLESMDFTALKPYVEGNNNMHDFVEYLNDIIGEKNKNM